MKVILLCGGQGLRIRDGFPDIPKALIPIGDEPLLWHVMRIYDKAGYNNFVLCLGYKGQAIVDYFTNNQIKVDIEKEKYYKHIYKGKKNAQPWSIEFVFTGIETNTSGRLAKVKKYVSKEEDFFLTYADGLANVDINELKDFHKGHGKTATLTAVKTELRYGFLKLSSSSVVAFDEKPISKQWINGGFFVFNASIFDVLDTTTALEENTLKKLAEQKQLKAFKHADFWIGIDNFKDYTIANEYYTKGVFK
jgi:glucose-1-phosphate cytidylyltransferase